MMWIWNGEVGFGEMWVGGCSLRECYSLLAEPA